MDHKTLLAFLGGHNKVTPSGGILEADDYDPPISPDLIQACIDRLLELKQTSSLADLVSAIGEHEFTEELKDGILQASNNDPAVISVFLRNLILTLRLFSPEEISQFLNRPDVSLDQRFAALTWLAYTREASIGLFTDIQGGGNHGKYKTVIDVETGTATILFIRKDNELQEQEPEPIPLPEDLQLELVKDELRAQRNQLLQSGTRAALYNAGSRIQEKDERDTRVAPYLEKLAEVHRLLQRFHASPAEEEPRN